MPLQTVGLHLRATRAGFKVSCIFRQSLFSLNLDTELSRRSPLPASLIRQHPKSAEYFCSPAMCAFCIKRARCTLTGICNIYSIADTFLPSPPTDTKKEKNMARAGLEPNPLPQSASAAPLPQSGQFLRPPHLPLPSGAAKPVPILTVIWHWVTDYGYNVRKNI